MSDGTEEFDELPGFEVVVPPEVEPDLVDVLPRGYLSPSQISMFLKCAYQWKLVYVDNKPRKTSARMYQGVFVHSGVEAVLRERLASGKLPPLEMATDTFSSAFDESKGLIDDWEGSEEGFVKDTGIKCAKAYYDEAAKDATPIAVEKTTVTVIRSEDGKIKLPILGRIDSIQVQSHTEQEYQDIRESVVSNIETPAAAKITKPKRINDLKVVTNKWPEGKLANDLFTIYAGSEHIPDVQVDQIVKGRAAVPRVRYERLTGVVTPQMVKHAENVALDVAKSIAMGNFPRTDPSNWNCSEKWCGMWEHCRGKTLATKL